MNNPYEKLWRDKADVYRPADTVVNGATRQAYSDTPITAATPCHLSKGALKTAGEDGAPTLVSAYTLYCAPGTNIQPGDKIIVTLRDGRQVRLTAGEGMPYTWQQEIAVKREDTA